MVVNKCKLWEDDADNKATYTAYLQDESPEIAGSGKRPAIVVCGGGGFMIVSDREKEPVALYFLNAGLQVFVLDYNTASIGDGSYPKPVYDLAKMLIIIREHTEEWHIDPNKIAVIGFSAGAHLCACMATQWQEKYLKEKMLVDAALMKPNAVILGYPVTDYPGHLEWFNRAGQKKETPSIPDDLEKFSKASLEAALGKNPSKERLLEASPITHVTKDTPPTFIWATATDEMVYVGNSLLFAKKLVDNGVDCELHMFEKGPHGMSTADKQSANLDIMIDPEVGIWKELAVKFLERHFND